jgi:hypothetical protein
MGKKRNAYRLLVRKPEGMGPLGRPRCRWVVNIRMDLGEVGWGDVDWIDLAQHRDRWRALVCDNEPLGSIKFWETIERLHNWCPSLVVLSSLELVRYISLFMWFIQLCLCSLLYIVNNI